MGGDGRHAGRGRDRGRPGCPGGRRSGHHRVLLGLRPQVRVHALGGGQQRRPLPRDRGGGSRDLVQRARVPGARRHRVHRDGHDGHAHPPHRRQLRPARRGREDPARPRRVEPGPHPHREQPCGALAERRQDRGIRAWFGGMGGAGRGQQVRALSALRARGIGPHRAPGPRAQRLLPEHQDPAAGAGLALQRREPRRLARARNRALVCGERGAGVRKRPRRGVRLPDDRSGIPGFRPDRRLQAGGGRQQRCVLPLQRGGHGRERLAGGGGAAGTLHRRNLRVLRARLAGAARSGARRRAGDGRMEHAAGAGRGRPGHDLVERDAHGGFRGC